VTSSLGAAAAAGPNITADFLGEAKPGNYRVISESTPVYEDKELSKPIKRAPAKKGEKSEQLSLSRDTTVEVTALEPVKPEKEMVRYIAKIKTNDAEGWTPLASLAQPTAPMKVQSK